MKGGTIRNNTARYGGGGVAVAAGGAFTKTGNSTIYGDTNTTHTEGADENTALTGAGHDAVYVGTGPRQRNADAVTVVNLNSATADNWE